MRERTVNLEGANMELRDFAYVVSHDLKAPLRGIARLVDWLAQDYGEHFDEEGRNMVALLIARVKRLDSLIEGILEYSRVGTHTEEAVVDLNQVVVRVIESLAVPDQVRITIDDPLPIGRYNMTRMFQVFENLISNAIKFLDKPQGTIRIGCQDSDSVWLFRVTDNGPGIEECHQERIFKIFQPLTSRDQHESTGIGLAIVKKL